MNRKMIHFGSPITSSYPVQLTIGFELIMKYLAQLLAMSSILLVLTSGRLDAQSEEIITKLPDIERVSLKTKDLVNLQCNFYPGGVVEGRDKKFTRVAGKEVVPVILVHHWGGQRGDYDALASYLQKLGHAIMVPDLRGHGNSTTRRLPGGDVEIDPERMRTADINAMVYDIEAVKKELLEKNNAGQLNIEMLTIVGAELGAITAMNYAALDWARPQLPFQKQGRDVKALALLSPAQSFKGATLTKSLRAPAVRQLLSVMLVVGAGDAESAKDAKAIHSRLERYHKEPDPKDVVEKKSLFLVEKPTSLKGTDLVHPRAMLNVQFDVAKFIELRLVNKREDFPWKDRTSPLDAANE